ncbi:MAG: hypothetical protein ABW101_19505 [Candidatus Thiodiazotropha sp.]
MLEYVFFHETPWRQFLEFVEQQGLSPQSSVDDGEWTVMLPEDLDEALDERIEAKYDQCLEMNESLVAEEEGMDHVHKAGINVTLKDGRVVQAAVDPKLINRILDVITIEELGELVNAVADAVENPNDRPLCQR